MQRHPPFHEIRTSSPENIEKGTRPMIIISYFFAYYNTKTQENKKNFQSNEYYRLKALSFCIFGGNYARNALTIVVALVII